MKAVSFIMMLLIFLACKEGRKSSSNEKQGDMESKNIIQKSIDFEKSAEILDEKKYWEIINTSSPDTENNGIQMEVLLNQLTKLSPKEIIGFDLRSTKLLRRAYSSELWCAAYIIKGGCSDDAFQYFRCWLISQGKEFYYNAIKNPDILSEFDENLFYDCELEEFLYVPNKAFELITGKEIYDYVDYTYLNDENESFGDIDFNWSEDDENSLKKICPKLFKKYW